jgi:hypothetical protein
MAIYAILIFIIGILIGRWYKEYNIIQAAKNGTVLAVSGELYSVKKEDKRVH